MTSEGTYATRVEKNVRIPMRDGVRLAADLFVPDAEGQFPALVEYIPYRKDDMTVPRHGPHVYFAERGYVGVRLDVRGTGASEGLNTDEYPLQEQLDGYDAIEWIARQPWCDGNVAMFGSSYGGFTALQVATHQPPHLRTIIPIYATDDRYTDDCHYVGGTLRMYYDVGFYATRMVAWNALPPALDGLEADWARIWETHLEGNRPYMLTWLAHQANDPYWRPASVAGQYEAIACPVFIIGGWRDGYPNPPLRLFEHLRVPCRVLIGPWDHARPDAATPGPRIDYLHEMRRWLDHWLKGLNTGVLGEPPIAVYMQRYDEPRADRRLTTGEWRYLAKWPAPDRGELTLCLAPDGELAPEPPAGETSAEFAYVPAVGVAGGLWSGGLPVGLPGDQRPDEALSLVFTSAPLSEPVEVLGRPRALLRAGSSAEVAAFVVKLSDVAPGGASALVTRGVLNGTRRESLTDPSPLHPGEMYELTIELDTTGWIFEAGHRIRLSLAGADFPNTWPTPSPAVSRVTLGGAAPSRLVLPLAPAERPDVARPAFLPPPAARVLADDVSAGPAWEVREDVLRGTTTVHIEYGRRLRLPDGTEVEEQRTMDSTVSRADPAHASARGETRVRRAHRGLLTEATALGVLASSTQAFHLTVDLDVRVEGRPHVQRRWTASFPRLLL
ncbi:MAG: CocE/NonD family hydrolase [Candidatus Rokubacteria bacterium]|nr:CocE/NonD family hydrolase [Candidatus Rokubacteria bacterium]